MAPANAHRETEIPVDATTRQRPWRVDDLESLFVHANACTRTANWDTLHDAD